MTLARNWRSVVLFAYVALTAFLASHHEMWRDELEFWHHARRAPLSRAS